MADHDITAAARAVLAALTPAQRRMAAGAASELPPSGSREAGRSAANWWRTRGVLVRRGVLIDTSPARLSWTPLGREVAALAIEADHNRTAAACVLLLTNGDVGAVRCYGQRGAVALAMLRAIGAVDGMRLTDRGREIARRLRGET